MEIEFRKDKKLDPLAIQKISYLLRSRDNSEIYPIDPVLLDLIDHLQDHFNIDTIEIISGYRTNEFNESLLQAGHAVSPTSLHTQGKALDIHLDEIREETLRDYLRKLGKGGVGYYGMLDFVHVDTGPVRFWEEPVSGRKLVGILNSQSPVQLTSDQNDYLPHQSIQLRWQIQANIQLEDIQEIKLERFWRGKWMTCETKIPQSKNFTLIRSQVHCPSMPQLFGKYRVTFRLKELSNRHSSNEFYMKKE